jgi:hypothetical protein
MLYFFISRCKFRNYFSDLQVFGRKTPSAGECQGAKKNEEKDEKTEAAIGLPFPVLFFKKDQRNRPHDHFQAQILCNS